MNHLILRGVHMNLFAILAIFGGFAILFCIIAIVMYLLFSFGLYQMAKNQGIQYEWLAFIPIAQMYIPGKIIKTLKVFNFDIPMVELTLPVSLLVVIALGNIPFIGFLICIAFAMLLYSAVYKLFCLYKGRENAQTMLIISLLSLPLGGFMLPVYAFMIRNLRPLE
jgi:hypothetical protein